MLPPQILFDSAILFEISPDIASEGANGRPSWQLSILQKDLEILHLCRNQYKNSRGGNQKLVIFKIKRGGRVVLVTRPNDGMVNHERKEGGSEEKRGYKKRQTIAI